MAVWSRSVVCFAPFIHPFRTCDRRRAAPSPTFELAPFGSTFRPICDWSRLNSNPRGGLKAFLLRQLRRVGRGLKVTLRYRLLPFFAAFDPFAWANPLLALPARSQAPPAAATPLRKPQSSQVFTGKWRWAGPARPRMNPRARVG